MKDNFSILGSKIFDPKGVEFVPKGTNAQGRKYGWQRDITQDYNLIANVWGFNFLRITCWLGAHKDGYALFDNASDDAIVDTFTKRDKKVVVMFEAHDNKGRYFDETSSPTIGQLKEWFKEKVLKYKDNPYVWYNLMNEPGGGTAYNDTEKAKWVKFHQEMIRYIRDDLGASNVIICDAASWAQDTSGTYRLPTMIPQDKSSILSSGNLVKEFGGKKYENIAFNIHTYRAWGDAEDGSGPLDAKLTDYLTRCQAAGHSVFVGEYGSENTESREATELIHRVCPKLNVGLVGWHWGGGDFNDYTTAGGGFKVDKLDGSKPSNLTRLGSLIWDFNRINFKLDTLVKPTAPVTTPPVIVEPKPTTPVAPTPTPTPKPSVVKPAPVKKANLVITSLVSKPGKVVKGTTAVFEAVVKNTGGSAINNVWIGGNFFVDDKYISFDGRTTSLAPGASLTLTSNSYKATSDVKELKFVVDNKERVDESNENDNSLTISI